MKIGIFTDVHYCHADVLCETRRPSLALPKLREAMDAFRAEGVDLCLCLGDLTDHEEGDTRESVVACFREALSLIRSYEIPFHFIPGNHDYLMMTGEDLSAFGLQLPPYTFEAGGYRFLLLDANFRSDGRRYDVAGVEWTDSSLPADQCAFLAEALEEDAPCILCLHQNLDPFVEKHHIVKNAEEIREIIKGKVRLVLQGHYHLGHESTVDDIPYVTVPAMCEGEKNSYRILTF